MEKHIFISHSHQDRKLAEIIANYLTKITLRQFKIWYSSDDDGYGGIKAGKIWFDEILNHLEKSKVVIVILTPNSIDKPWIYFESGIGQALKDCEVIPILVGISKFSQVPPPLSLYQSFQISDYLALSRFTKKLLANYEIPFEEELSKDFIEKTITNIVEASELVINKQENQDSTNLEELKNYFENHFNDLKSMIRPSVNIQFESYEEVSIDINIDNFKTKQYLEIRETESIGTILHRIYFMIKNHVQSYTYLEQWVLRDKISKQFLIIKEVQDQIPAKLFFNNKHKWEVLKLEKPYDIRERNVLESMSNRV